MSAGESLGVWPENCCINHPQVLKLLPLSKRITKTMMQIDSLSLLALCLYLYLVTLHQCKEHYPRGNLRSTWLTVHVFRNTPQKAFECTWVTAGRPTGAPSCVGPQRAPAVAGSSSCHHPLVQNKPPRFDWQLCCQGLTVSPSKWL